jgi:hypothetical protein
VISFKLLATEELGGAQRPFARCGVEEITASTGNRNPPSLACSNSGWALSAPSSFPYNSCTQINKNKWFGVAGEELIFASG